MAEFTGERVVPGQVDPDLLNEHLARYAFAARLCRHKKVLDLGCGTGYGTAELARHALFTTGVDVSADAIGVARRDFAARNLSFLRASCTQLPFPDAAFHLVAAFEVIEHLSAWPRMLDEARRVLKPGGQFIVSTPNRLYYAESRKQTGPNPFHDHEFEFDEFRLALEGVFPSVSLFLQNHAAGIVFQPVRPDQAADVAIAGQAIQPEDSHFFLAVCALTPQLGAPTFVYLPSTANILRERELHIERLQDELTAKNAWLDQARAEHQQLVEMYRAQIVEIEKKNQWAEQINAELTERRRRIVELQDEIAAQQAEWQKAAAGYEEQIAHMDEESRRISEWAQETERALRADLEARTYDLRNKCDELARCAEVLRDAERLVEERTLWAQALQADLDAARSRLENYLAQVKLARASRWLKLGRTIGIGPDLREQ